ncbi:hypothetical protein IR152_15765 [Clostridioides sp. ES-S-0108-01]|uniref:hypothetical protein n=1 Tax=Clostridioides sp. ES-S-0108-01 TaxID=2770773 RepID=UPI001D0C0862|nr:hypothetical protein [Clostridioides sp. ES-S-0108-01]UDN53113.1 hypothetical protein JJC16_18925 [Clostridioides sp. ES-S-0107-01]
MINNIEKVVSLGIIQFVTILLLIGYYFGGLKYTLILGIFIMFLLGITIIKTSLN